MPEITLAAPLDPDDNGVGYFQYFLEDIEREKGLLEFFGFLGMPIVEASTFVSDYQIVFKDKNLEVVVRNDDFGCEALGTSPEETVYFSVKSDSEIELMKLQKKLEENIRVVKLS